MRPSALTGEETLDKIQGRMGERYPYSSTGINLWRTQALRDITSLVAEVCFLKAEIEELKKENKKPHAWVRTDELSGEWPGTAYIYRCKICGTPDREATDECPGPQ